VVALVAAGVSWSRRDVSTGVPTETPSRIDIEISGALLRTEENYKVSITNQTDCAAVIQALSLGRKVRPHACASLGTMTVHYANGGSSEVRLLPGHEEGRYEFSFNGLYSIPSAKLAEAITRAGLDKSKLLLRN